MTIRIWSFACALALASVAGAQDDKKAEPKAEKASTAKLENNKQKASYSIGVNIGRQLKKAGFLVDVDSLGKGIADVFAEVNLALTDEQMQEETEAFQTAAAAEKEQRMQADAAKNKEEGDAYLAANKAKEGVTTLPSGLQYSVVKAGDGPTPKATDTVRTHYRGTLISGTEFDSSYKRGEPAEFPVKGVIKGWTEALQLMKVGSKWKLFIPSELAYGARGAGDLIGPNCVLIFDIELLSIE